MAVRYWTGSTGDGDFANTSNWLGGVVPTGTDPAVFDRGNYSVTAGLTPTWTPDYIQITAGYQGSIGTTSAALVPTGAIGYILCSGRGAYYKIGSGSTVGTSASVRNQINLQSGTEFVAASGTWTFTVVQGGSFRAEAAAVVSTAIALTRTRAMFLTNGTAITKLDADDGTDITTYRNITTARASGPGTLRFQSTAVAATLCTVSAGHTVSIANTSASTHVAIDAKPGGRVLIQEATATPTITTLTVGSNTSIQRYSGGITLSIGTEINNGFSQSDAPFGGG